MRNGVQLHGDERKSSSSVQTIQRASAILRCFMENDTEMGVTILSQQVGIHKSTVSRLLSTLRKEGFVDQNPDTGKWWLGLGLLDLAGAVLERMDLRKVALIPLRNLAAQTQETVNITVLDGNECVNIENISSPKSIQHAGRLGRRTPLHCTSTGKAFLAFLTTEERDVLLSSTLLPCTENSIVDRRALEQALEHVREQGYAITHEEYEEGLSAVAAPIRDHTGRVVATVSISGPSYRMGPDQIEKFVEPLKDIAHNISTQLGYVQPKSDSRER
jgi:DNA-binding IclR family transcriptional regulator